MAVTVPYLARVDAFPGGANQFMPLECVGYAGAAGIDETLFRPVPPGGEPARAKREGAREREELSARTNRNRAIRLANP